MVLASWNIAVSDVAFALGLSPEELPPRERATAYLLSRLTVDNGPQACMLTPRSLTQLENKLPRESYLSLAFSVACANKIEHLRITSTFMFAADAEHRTFVRAGNQGSPYTAMLSATVPSVKVFLQEKIASSQLFWSLIMEGVSHILEGYDHLLFLFALLLPLFFGEGVATHRQRLLQVLRYCTAFTLGHSLTLALAGLKICSPSVGFIEAAIALSISLVAVNNFWHFWGDSLVIIFALGLIHGFGFANVMQDLSLLADQQILALLFFNCGVELGQFLVIAMYYPLLWTVRTLLPVYRLASAVCLLIGIYWFVERSMLYGT